MKIQFFSSPSELFWSCVLASPSPDSWGLEFRVELVTVTFYSILQSLVSSSARKAIVIQALQCRRPPGPSFELCAIAEDADICFTSLSRRPWHAFVTTPWSLPCPQCVGGLPIPCERKRGEGSGRGDRETDANVLVKSFLRLYQDIIFETGHTNPPGLNQLPAI